MYEVHQAKELNKAQDMLEKSAEQIDLLDKELISLEIDKRRIKDLNATARIHYRDDLEPFKHLGDIQNQILLICSEFEFDDCPMPLPDRIDVDGIMRFFGALRTKLSHIREMLRRPQIEKEARLLDL